VDILSIGVGRMQRNFEPMLKQVETGKQTQLTDQAAKLVIYRAFVEGGLDLPKHLTRRAGLVLKLTRCALDRFLCSSTMCRTLISRARKEL